MSRRLTAVIGFLGALLVIAALVMYGRQLWGGRPGGPAGPSMDSQPLPFDTAITTATLPNGLRYFVRANELPPGRAELRLVVNAGSLVEDDDQRGLAHFLEHMAFNGTKRFPGQAIGAFLESVGMRFGPSVNASTSFDETTYSIQIPTDDPAVFDRALMVLEDWAHNVSLDAAEIDRERGVVIEEWRMRRGAGARLYDVQFPVMLQGTRYVDRLPIGTPESIQTFSHDRLRQFYADWYRPDLMAVIAVGDFDPKAVAARIERGFGSIPAATTKRPKPEVRLPASAGGQVIVTDPEATSTSLALLHRRAPGSDATVGDYRRDTVERLALGMLSTRLNDIAQMPKGPFVSAGASVNRSVRHAEFVTLAALVSQVGVLPALSALAIERERVIRFGFTEPELERQKTTLKSGYERAIAERGKLPSSALAAEYGRHFTVDEPVPGIQWEHDTIGRILPGVTIAEVNAAITAAIPEAGRIVAVAAPQKPTIYIPREDEMAAVLASARNASVEPWVVRTTATKLLESEPSPGSVARAVAHESIGVTEWYLSNGARVILKPTDFKEDQVVFTAVSPGGTSLAPDEDVLAAQMATQIVTTMGFGRFGSGDLRRMLTGRSVSVQPVIGVFEEGMSGGSSRAELETMFQLIHLAFTAPRRDANIFGALQGQMRAALGGQSSTPEFAFSQALARTLSQDHPRGRPIDESVVGRMDMDKSLAFYRDRFGDAGDFTFVFAGSFTPDTIRPFVERYLASLPSAGRKETWRDPGFRPPRGIVERVVERGIEQKARTAIVFTGPIEVNRARAMQLGAMAEVLQVRLRDAIREELGGTYNIGANGTASRLPAGQYAVTIDFGADPGRIDALAKRVLGEVATFRKSGPTPREVQDIRAAIRRDYETNSRQNAYIAGQLAQRAQTGEPLETAWQFEETFNTITPAALHDVAKQTLDLSNYVRVTLKPGK